MRESARAVAASGHGAKWHTLADALEANVHDLTASYCLVLENHLARAIAELESADLTRLNRDELMALSRRQVVIATDVEQVSHRLQGRVMTLTEARLQTLDEYLSAALQLSAVRPELNPFRPEIMCNVLAELCLQKLGDTTNTELWANYLLPPFAGGLKRMYMEMTSILTRQGVSDARFKLNLAQVRGEPLPQSAAGQQPVAAAQGTVSLSLQHPRSRGSHDGAVEQVHDALGKASTASTHKGPQATERRGAQLQFPSMQQLARIFPSVSREVVQAFLYDRNWAALDAPLPPSFLEALENTIKQFTKAALEASPPSSEAVAEFHIHRRKLPPVERGSIPLALNDWLSGAHWGRWSSPVLRAEQVMGLKVQAQQISQVMAIDCVGLMLEQLGGETSLLLPVREAFMALSPALMRLAFDQPWFLASEEHPARRFIEVVAQASYEFNDEYAESFDFFLRPIVQHVKTLQSLEQSSGKDIEIAFALALRQLQGQWESMSQSEHQGVEGKLKAMHFVSERQALARQLAAELAQDEVIQAAPEPVARLMLEKWSVVLAHVRLIDERKQPDPGGYRAMARDLVWSLSGHAAVNDPVRAFNLLPGTLNKLREGLLLIGTKPEEVNAALGLLMPFHERLFEMRRRRLAVGTVAPQTGFDPVESALLETVPASLEVVDTPFDAQALLQQVETTPWMNTQDREVMGFSMDTQSGPQSLQTGYTELSTLQPDLEEDSLTPEQKLESMREKDWFDMSTAGEWSRVQLVWRNDQGTLFMFQSRQGSPHSMTRRSCLRLLKQEMLRPVLGAGARSVTPLLDHGE